MLNVIGRKLSLILKYIVDKELKKKVQIREENSLTLMEIREWKTDETEERM